jgi:hypothetical protein
MMELRHRASKARRDLKLKIEALVTQDLGAGGRPYASA